MPVPPATPAPRRSPPGGRQPHFSPPARRRQHAQRRERALTAARATATLRSCRSPRPEPEVAAAGKAPAAGRRVTLAPHAPPARPARRAGQRQGRNGSDRHDPYRFSGRNCGKSVAIMGNRPTAGGPDGRAAGRRRRAGQRTVGAMGRPGLRLLGGGGPPAGWVCSGSGLSQSRGLGPVARASPVAGQASRGPGQSRARPVARG